MTPKGRQDAYGAGTIWDGPELAFTRVLTLGCYGHRKSAKPGITAYSAQLPNPKVLFIIKPRLVS